MATFIYKPKGAAAEYGEYALNIYTGCPHGCTYCYSPRVLRREKNEFHNCVAPRENIVEAVKNQLKSNEMKGKTIHLCFTCDPYPLGYDSTATRDIIKAIKDSGNHVQILTKNGKDAMRDFDLLDENDWFGITYAGYDESAHIGDYVPDEEPGAGEPYWRLYALCTAYNKGIKTWVSCEPVINTQDVLMFIEFADYVNLWKVGKMNYVSSNIDWKDFGEKAEELLIKKKDKTNSDYCIKEGLRKIMEQDKA
jgi:DNA repair photolyase